MVPGRQYHVRTTEVDSANFFFSYPPFQWTVWVAWPTTKGSTRTPTLRSWICVLMMNLGQTILYTNRSQRNYFLNDPVISYKQFKFHNTLRCLSLALVIWISISRDKSPEFIENWELRIILFNAQSNGFKLNVFKTEEKAKLNNFKSLSLSH